jgi:hypothetical protein
MGSVILIQTRRERRPLIKSFSSEYTLRSNSSLVSLRCAVAHAKRFCLWTVVSIGLGCGRTFLKPHLCRARSMVPRDRDKCSASSCLRRWRTEGLTFARILTRIRARTSAVSLGGRPRRGRHRAGMDCFMRLTSRCSVRSLTCASRASLRRL